MIPKIASLLFLAPSLLAPATSFVIYPEAAVFHTQPTPPERILSSPDQEATANSPTKPPSSPTLHIWDDDSDDSDSPLPVLIWHGLGDSADADGLKSVAELINTVHPGTYVSIISVAAEGSADRSASFFGNVSEQIENVCDKLKQDNILATAPAVDAVGFSQGGQFLRGLVERCEGGPKLRSLITFGAQHNGISKFQRCKDGGDWVCRGAEALVRSGGVWADFVQSRIVPAQYFRDPEDLSNYLEHSAFLADVNNERKLKNRLYKTRLSALENFVMVMFADDETVVPKESSWWAEVNGTTGTVTWLKDRDIYKEDWLGLKALDKKGGLAFEMVEGGHMRLKDEDLTRLFAKYFGPMSESESMIEGKSGQPLARERWAEEL